MGCRTKEWAPVGRIAIHLQQQVAIEVPPVNLPPPPPPMSEGHRFDDERTSWSYLFAVKFAEVDLSCQAKPMVGGMI